MSVCNKKKIIWKFKQATRKKIVRRSRFSEAWFNYACLSETVAVIVRLLTTAVNLVFQVTAWRTSGEKVSVQCIVYTYVYTRLTVLWLRLYGCPVAAHTRKIALELLYRHPALFGQMCLRIPPKFCRHRPLGVRCKGVIKSGTQHASLLIAAVAPTNGHFDRCLTIYSRRHSECSSHHQNFTWARYNQCDVALQSRLESCSAGCL